MEHNTFQVKKKALTDIWLLNVYIVFYYNLHLLVSHTNNAKICNSILADYSITSNEH